MSKLLDGNKSDSDYRLLKYKPIDKYLIDSLVKRSLWCAKPDTLNDPLDCQIDLLEAIRRAHSLGSAPHKEFLGGALEDPERIFIESMRRALKVGICSFSLYDEYSSDSVQWAHYADKHKGARLSYRIPHSFIAARSDNWDNSKELFGLFEVNCKDDVFTNWLAHTNTAGPDFITELASCYFTAKSPAWKYEREVRIIRRKHGYLEIHKGCLEEVCFGLRTPAEDVELVTRLAREYCGCERFYKMEHDEKSDFGIKKVELVK
jgi:hypothetical protein